MEPIDAELEEYLKRVTYINELSCKDDSNMSENIGIFLLSVLLTLVLVYIFEYPMKLI